MVNLEKIESEIIENYDSDEDIKRTGGSGGIDLADKLFELKTRGKKSFFMDNSFSKRIKSFLIESENVSNVSLMRNLLSSYFPRRFGISGKQDVYETSDNKVFGIFNHVRDYYLEKIQ